MLRALAVIVVLLASGATLVVGQVSGGGLEVTRQGLQQLLSQYEQTAASSSFSAQVRAQAATDAEAIRQRLRNGDFHTGDEITLQVEGEESLTGAFIVNNAGSIALPVVGDVSLQGVLRSELQDHLTARLANFLVNPIVRAHSSVRIMISGNVTRPGFHVVPTQDLVSASIMEEAGGPAPLADMSRIRIERGGRVLIGGDELQTAIAQGLTVDQLGLQSGDNIIVPATRSTGISQLVTTVVPAILLALVSIRQLF